jgi:hypothetical protein
LIPANKSYIQQRQVYDGQCKRAGLSNMHGLRHRYAQTRYTTLTGWVSPKAGGPKASQLDSAQRQKDRDAQREISRELGHERIAVTAVYLGQSAVMRSRGLKSGEPPIRAIAHAFVVISPQEVVFNQSIITFIR